MKLINGLANAVKSRLFVKLALKRIERIVEWSILQQKRKDI